MGAIGKLEKLIRLQTNESNWKNGSNSGKMDQRGKWIKREKWINFVDKKKNSVIVCLVSGEPFTGAPF